MQLTHQLKVNPQFWDALKDGSKPFELRRNDRDFHRGDLLELYKYDHSFGYIEGIPPIYKQIGHVLFPEDCPGLNPGFVILGLIEP